MFIKGSCLAELDKADRTSPTRFKSPRRWLEIEHVQYKKCFLQQNKIDGKLLLWQLIWCSTSSKALECFVKALYESSNRPQKMPLGDLDSLSLVNYNWKMFLICHSNMHLVIEFFQRMSRLFRSGRICDLMQFVCWLPCHQYAVFFSNRGVEILLVKVSVGGVTYNFFCYKST